MGTVLLVILCSILMLVGLIGVVVPLVPGVPLAWAGLFIYALVTGFEEISVAATVVFFFLMLFTVALDLLAPMLGARKYRASKWGVLGVFLGFIAGIFLFGVVGVILGPFLVALLGELVANKLPRRAFQSALGALVGFLAGTLFKLMVVLIIMGYFIVSLF